MKTVYLVRHGETDANLQRYLADRSELLNDAGVQQAAVVGKRLASLRTDALVASDWPRAQQTAEIIGEHINLNVQTMSELGEHVTPASLAGSSYTDPLYEAYVTECADRWGDPEFQFENAENYFDLFQRAEQLREQLESMEAESIVAVSHSRFLRFFTAYMTLRDTLTPKAELHMSKVLRPKNTSITSYVFDGAGWNLVTWNDIAHFAE